MIHRTTYLKNSNLKNLFFAARTALVGLLLLTACRQEPDAPAAKAADKVDAVKVTALEALAHKFDFTEAEYQQYEQGMRELNAKELDLFNDLEGKRFLATPNLPEGDKENIVRMVALKKELNRRTLKEFNKPYSQVEGSKVIPIVEALYGKSKVLAAGGKVASCPYTGYIFPTATGVGNIFKVACGNVANVQAAGSSDCDYQYSFSTAQANGWGLAIGRTPYARGLLTNSVWGHPAGFGGSVSRRRGGETFVNGDYTGNNYCLLLGKTRVDFAYGSAWPLAQELGMGI